jgi:phosphate starvation-inducible PhoH-like protein
LDDRIASIDLALEPADNRRLANLCGPFDQNLRQIEQRLGIEVNRRGNAFRLLGAEPVLGVASAALESMYDAAADGPLAGDAVSLLLHQAGVDEVDADGADASEEIQIRTRRGMIEGRSPNQRRYLRGILTHDLSFGIGPAGTGKTYLAVACAVDALEREAVRRLVLVRPAVEAGERLGFLPGDLVQKVDPYLRPLYDALYEMLGFERVGKLLERHVIEVAPLAFMRGRTLNDSFVILDEAQNTTVEQMKMFLTRIGFGSTAVVTGDITQVDLPRGQTPGLRQVIDVLRGIEGISFTFFQAADVVRHPLVQRIVSAYMAWERKEQPGPAEERH